MVQAARRTLLTRTLFASKCPVSMACECSQLLNAVLSSDSYLATTLHLMFRFFFFLNDPPPPEIYPLPQHAPLPISQGLFGQSPPQRGRSSRASTEPPLTLEVEFCSQLDLPLVPCAVNLAGIAH